MPNGEFSQLINLDDLELFGRETIVPINGTIGTLAGAINGLSSEVDDIEDNIANSETSPAESAHSEGDYIYYNGQLYKVTADIDVGDTLTVGTNITATIVADELNSNNGHDIQNSSGTTMTERTNLKFGGDLTTSDDSANDATVITPYRLTSSDLEDIFEGLTPGGGNIGHIIQDASGTSMSARTNLKFAGDLIVSDDSANDATVIAPSPTILSTTGAGYHNSIYRGKNLGTSVTQEQWNAINSGTFDDMYIGDYWVINNITWRIAAFDYWYNFGDTACSTHHIVIIPDSNLLNADGSTTHFMNDSNVTTGAYVGSGFYSGTNPGTGTSNTAKANCTTIVNNAFGSAHILTHREYLLNAVTNGRQSAGAWYDSTIEIPNEHMIYGKHFEPVSDGTNIPAIYTIDNAQLPLFIFDHSKICNRANWWLRDVVSASYFAFVAGSGRAASSDASNALFGVRPVFAIRA